MKHFLMIPLALLIVFSSCNLDNTKKLSDEELRELKRNHNDIVTLQLDSANKIEIPVYTPGADSLALVDSLRKIRFKIPPLYDKEIFDSATTIKFFELAKATHGEVKLLINSKLITTEISKIIKAHAADNGDLLLLIDKTGSMSDDIENVKEGLSKIISTIKDFKNIRLGIALYGDKNVDGAGWFSFNNFEKDYDSAQNFIAGIDVTMGGDYPESVYDGFFKSCEQNFFKSENKKMIVLIGDAPPLEKPLSDYGLRDVIKKANESKIKMNFYPIVVTPSVEIESPAATEKTFVKDKIISTLYPNPSRGTINVNFGKRDKYMIEIFNTSGAMVFSESFSGSLWHKDIPKLTNGAYILRATSKEKKFETIKFLITK